MEIAIQTIVWGEARSKDLPRVIREAAQAGYVGMELRPPQDIPGAIELMKQHGLRLSASHGSAPTIERELDGHFRWLEATGAHILACSGSDYPTSAQYREIAANLERAGKICCDHGVTLCYHNHAHEITHDMFGLGHILHNTDPAHVKLCPDTYWVQRGGQDPAAFLRLLGNRVGYLHLKDMAPDGTFAEVGQGVLDWDAIRQVVMELKLPWCAVEQDRSDRTPLESSAMSRAYLKEHWGM